MSDATLKNSPPRPWLRWLPAFLLMLVLFTLSSIPDAGFQTTLADDPIRIPSLGTETMNRIVKKSGHFLAFALLGQAYLFALGENNRKNRWLALLFASLYGLSDEFHQTFVAGRGASLWDVGIDSLGAAMGLLIRHRPPTS